MIKNNIDLLSPILVRLVNISFETGCFPDPLKIAKIVPIFKGGDSTILSNYRPISILPTVSKIIERLVYNRLMSHLEINNILSNNQFGFRKKLSPQSAILSMLNQTINSIERGNYVIGIFLDLKKAFDTIDHTILLKKLKHYGIRSNALKWFISYLTGRRQYTNINDCTSNLLPITHGVPQGSTLGPLLFLLYINDLVNASQNLKYILFADDTNLFCSGPNLKDLCDIVNTELNIISNWLNINKLTINISKTFYLIFTRRKLENISISLCNQQLKRKNSIKFLGVIVDDKLCWREHINYICKKISKSIGIIRKIKDSLNEQSKIMLYYTMIYPYLQYCVAAWGAACPTHLKPLISKQKCIAKMIKSESSLLKLSDIYNLEVLKFMHSQIINNPNPIISFRQVLDIHNVNTRNRHDLRPIHPNSELAKRFITYKGCLLWNNLPNYLKSFQNSTTFKINVKKHLLLPY